MHATCRASHTKRGDQMQLCLKTRGHAEPIPRPSEDGVSFPHFRRPRRTTAHAQLHQQASRMVTPGPLTTSHLHSLAMPIMTGIDSWKGFRWETECSWSVRCVFATSCGVHSPYMCRLLKLDNIWDVHFIACQLRYNTVNKALFNKRLRLCCAILCTYAHSPCPDNWHGLQAWPLQKCSTATINHATVGAPHACHTTFILHAQGVGLLWTPAGLRQEHA